MAELKTRKNESSVDAFIAALPDERQRADSLALVRLMSEVTGDAPSMWGSSIVGFGEYRYKYPSGREGSWFLTGFSPRKATLTLYIMSGFQRYSSLLEQLGKYRTGKACLYVKRLSDVEVDVLRELVAASVAAMRKS